MQEFENKISDKEFTDYYIEHSAKQTAKYFDVKTYLVNQRAQKLKLFKKSKIKTEEDFLSKYTFDEFKEYLFNHTNEDTQKYFNLT